MALLLENLSEFINMILAVLVRPNYAAEDESLSIINYLFSPQTQATRVVNNILLLTFGIALAGVSIGILKRFLWKS